MDNEEITDFGQGYDIALSAASEWLENTAKEWYALKIVSAEQMLALVNLIHDFEISFLYEYKGV